MRTEYSVSIMLFTVHAQGEYSYCKKLLKGGLIVAVLK